MCPRCMIRIFVSTNSRDLFHRTRENPPQFSAEFTGGHIITGTPSQTSCMAFFWENSPKWAQTCMKFASPNKSSHLMTLDFPFLFNFLVDTPESHPPTSTRIKRHLDGCLPHIQQTRQWEPMYPLKDAWNHGLPKDMDPPLPMPSMGLAGIFTYMNGWFLWDQCK